MASGTWEKKSKRRESLSVGTRVRFERVDHVRELDGITNEKGREVVADQIPVTVSRIELGGEAVRVAQCFRRVITVNHGGEAYKYRGLLAGFENGRLAQVADVGGGRELAFDASATGMHDALRDAFAIKALQLLQQLHVLQQDRPFGACGLKF